MSTLPPNAPCEYCGEATPHCGDPQHAGVCCVCYEVFDLRLGTEPFEVEHIDGTKYGLRPDVRQKIAAAIARGHPAPPGWEDQ